MKEGNEVHGLTNYRYRLLVDDATGQQMKVELLAIDNDCMSSVIATLSIKKERHIH
jgi:hypothetical protein